MTAPRLLGLAAALALAPLAALAEPEPAAQEFGFGANRLSYDAGGETELLRRALRDAARHWPEVDGLDVDDALENIEERLEEVDPAGWEAVQDLEFVDDSKRLQGFAVAAMTERRPWAAIGAQLLAWQEDEAEAVILINLAGMVAMRDMAANALALLEEAEDLESREDFDALWGWTPRPCS